MLELMASRTKLEQSLIFNSRMNQNKQIEKSFLKAPKGAVKQWKKGKAEILKKSLKEILKKSLKAEINC